VIRFTADLKKSWQQISAASSGAPADRTPDKSDTNEDIPGANISAGRGGVFAASCTIIMSWSAAIAEASLSAAAAVVAG